MEFEIGTGLVGFIMLVGVPVLIYQMMSSANDNGLGKDTTRSKYELVAVAIGFFVIVNMMGTSVSVNTDDILPVPSKSGRTTPIEPAQQFGVGNSGDF